ncbi:MAG: hypothetical protein LBC80_09795 [Treponema sp.]|jgi:hypothetical protein|nr:hypothetical protein [Treponema sp.]
MENVQTANSPRLPDGNANFDSVWAILQENALQMNELRESQRETAKRQEETDRLLKESIAASEKERHEYNKRFGNLDNRFSDVIESMITPGLLDKLNDLGLEFQTAAPNYKIRDHKNKIYFEIDAFLQNSDVAMLVEIKTNLSIKYINEHINRLEKMRAYADIHGDKRTFLGAVAGIVVPSEVKQYVWENGFYMIEPSGDNFNITPPNNKPKEW